MNVLKKFIVPALALGMLAACSDDNKFDGPENPATDGASVAMSISVQLPTAQGGRADNPTNIGNPATEAGSEAECKINKMILVLADPSNNGFVDYAEADIVSGTNVVNCKATFSISSITNYLNGLSGTTSVNVFAFCNYTDDFSAYLATLSKNDKSTDWIDKHATVNTSSADISGKWNTSLKTTGIPMANVAIFTKDLPTVTTISQYNEDNPFELSSTSNPIKVERSIARFDFKDGSENGDFTYNIYDAEDSKINVIIDRIALVNMSNCYYYLRHTAPNGSSNSLADLTKTTILDANNPWIIDVDAADKAKYTDGVSNNFLFPVVSSDGQPGRSNWYSTPVSAFKNADDDNASWEGEEGYKVWRYVTENTIPTASLQKNGQSTGVVFKAKLAFEGTGELATALNNAKENKEAIYFFKNDKVVPLGAAEDVKKANSVYADAFKAAVGEKNPAECKEALTKAGFIIYEPATGEGSSLGTDDVAGEYYMYYYYWNQHNDNNDVNVMAPMEFGVVRNHIYKLKVEEITGLGHPRKPENDPDPEKPGDDDEEGKIAIKIAVQTVDWSVRENGIKL